MTEFRALRAFNSTTIIDLEKEKQEQVDWVRNTVVEQLFNLKKGLWDIYFTPLFVQKAILQPIIIIPG